MTDVKLRVTATAALVVGLLTTAGCAMVGSGAACAAPEATIAPESAAPEQSVTLSGRNWGVCNDTNHRFLPPWDHVNVRWVQSGEVIATGQIPIDDGIDFRITQSVPADALPGDATVIITSPDDDPYEVSVPMTIEAP